MYQLSLFNLFWARIPQYSTFILQELSFLYTYRVKIEDGPPTAISERNHCSRNVIIYYMYLAEGVNLMHNAVIWSPQKIEIYRKIEKLLIKIHISL